MMLSYSMSSWTCPHLLIMLMQNLASPHNVVESQISLEVAACLKSLSAASGDALEQTSASLLRRAVMGHLRSQGFDAAVCKSRWEHSRGFPGG